MHTTIPTCTAILEEGTHRLDKALLYLRADLPQEFSENFKQGIGLFEKSATCMRDIDVTRGTMSEAQAHDAALEKFQASYQVAEAAMEAAIGE